MALLAPANLGECKNSDKVVTVADAEKAAVEVSQFRIAAAIKE